MFHQLAIESEASASIFSLLSNSYILLYKEILYLNTELISDGTGE